MCKPLLFEDFRAVGAARSGPEGVPEVRYPAAFRLGADQMLMTSSVMNEPD